MVNSEWRIVVFPIRYSPLPIRFSDHVSIFTYSKSPGLLSMPTFGGEIQDAYWPVSVTGVISEAMKSPSSEDGSHSPLRLLQVASSISTPSGVAWISLNSPIWRWNATVGSVSLEWKPASEMILFQRSEERRVG